MSDKVLGGHAIMLRVRIPDELVQIAQAWVAEKLDVRKLKLKHETTMGPVTAQKRPDGTYFLPDGLQYHHTWHSHVTLVHLGRDLKLEVGEKMLRVGEHLSTRKMVEDRVFFEQTAMFGYKNDHLAAKVWNSAMLEALHVTASDLLAYEGIRGKRDFAWNPHVTLGVGEPNWVGIQQTFGSQPPFGVCEGYEVKIGDRIEFFPQKRVGK